MLFTTLFLIISVATLILQMYVIRNLLVKYEIMEEELEKTDEFFLEFYNDMKSAYDRMKKIDRLGSFESDDESGFIFEQIKSSMEMLNKRLDLDATKEKE